MSSELLEQEESSASETQTPKRTDPKNPLGNLIRAWDGALTEELVRKPGGFGLGQLPVHQVPDRTTTATCGYCSTGCGLRINIKDGEAVSLTPDTDYPVNKGMACPKGWEALEVLKADDRAQMPMLRQSKRGEDKSSKPSYKEVEWSEALETFTSKFKSIQEKYGPESIAFLSTGQICSEEMAFLGALAKFGMGMKHGDGNTRQCMATAVVAYKQSFGFDAPPYTYQDFEESDVIVLVGSNLCLAHPIMWQRVLNNPNDPTIIAIDPRRTETAMAARMHLPLAPKSDLVLFYGLANLLIEAGHLDHEFIQAHTNEFEAFKSHVSQYTTYEVTQVTGLSETQLRDCAAAIGQGKRVSFWWTMGVNQSHEGTRVAQAIINLALMTGNIGRPGTGANSITGQCNAMGSRLFSNTTNLLGGHDFANDEHRQKVAEITGIDASVMPRELGMSYYEIVEGIARGKIKGLWVIATNSSHSWIGQNQFNEIIENLDFMVVQDMYHTTETAQQADLILPAAAWSEKDGTFINSERRIGLVKKLAKAPGQALSDFNIFKLIASSWGCGEMFKKWDTAENVFQMLKALTKDQPCDMTGVQDYQMLDAWGGMQWPFTPEMLKEIEAYQSETSLNSIYHQKEKPPFMERRLFEDGRFYHPDEKAKFLFEKPREVKEKTSKKYPYVLLTGRGTASQWHTQTRTSKSKVLRKLYPQEIYVEIHPQDARELDIRASYKVKVTSPRGSLHARAVITPTVRPGQVFIPMHYEETNQLTNPDFDPYSKQPSYKHCAVNVRALKHYEI